MKLCLSLRHAILAVAVFGFLALGTSAKADLVQNGNFTNTTLSSPGGYVCNTVGPVCTSTVADWSADCSSTDECGDGGTPLSLLFAGSGGAAFNNGNGLNFPQSDPPGGGNYIGDDGDPIYRAPIFQTINGLTPGAEYLLTFYQASSQQGGFFTPTSDQWQVSLGSQTQLSDLMTAAPGNTDWQLETMTFTAASATEVLNFLSIGPSGVPPVVLLADVALDPVPEPTSVALFAGVAGLLVMNARRRRRA